MMEAALRAAPRGGAPLAGEIRAALGDPLVGDLVRVSGRTEAEVLEYIAEEIPRLLNLGRLASLVEGLEAHGSIPLSSAVLARESVERPIVAAEEGPFRELLDDLTQVAQNPYSILITGPSGSGKELIARRIHELSPFSRGPFVPVDCAGLPEGLVEAELFGHQKGAFTGAVRARPGKLELAAGGTLFLDEVAEASGGLPGKAAALPPGEGGGAVGRGPARGSEGQGGGRHQPGPAKDDGPGAFPRDLFYRLATIPLRLPPLRERPSDIPLLIDHYLARAKEETGLSRGLSREVREVLKGYDFPGNVRELINLVNQMVALSKKHVIGLEDLPPSVQKSLGGGGRGPAKALAVLASAGIRPKDRPALARLLAQARGDRITNSDLRGVLDCSDTTAKKILHRLAQAGLLLPEGTRAAEGTWSGPS